MRVIRLEARRGAHVNAPRISQVARVVHETKVFVLVELIRRFDGVGAPRIDKFSKAHGRLMGSDGLYYHGWRIVGESFEGVPSEPQPLKEYTDNVDR